LKNEERLKLDTAHKYRVVGNGTELSIGNIDYADTGAYMCQASNVGGVTRDISSLIVQEVLTPSKFCVTRGESAGRSTYSRRYNSRWYNVRFSNQPLRKKNDGFSHSTIGACPCTNPPLAGSTTKSNPPTLYPEPRYAIHTYTCLWKRPDGNLKYKPYRLYK